MKIVRNVISLILCLLFVGCSTVNITKTGKGIYPITNPAEVQIKAIAPTEPFVEIGIVSCDIYGTDPSKAYNTLREKASKLGADAIILNNQVPVGSRLIINGAAIKYE